jgi:hypothetical protein
VIAWMIGLPGWLWAHPWSSAGLLVLGMVAFTSLILVNPEDRQVRDFFRRKR